MRRAAHVLSLGLLLLVPYTLDKLVPALSGAVDGDPATPADPSA